MTDQSYREEAETLRRIVMEALAEHEEWEGNAPHPNPTHWSNRARVVLGVDSD